MNDYLYVRNANLRALKLLQRGENRQKLELDQRLKAQRDTLDKQFEQRAQVYNTVYQSRGILVLQ